MFHTPKIFSHFSELVSYVGTRNVLLRPKQFHSENKDIQDFIKKIEKDFCINKAFFLAQCQSSEVVEITEDIIEDIIFADACITKLQNISLNVVVADCVPILLYDTKNKITWAVHAGWKWSAGRILEKTLLLMQEKYDSLPEDIYVYIGPSICRSCYEVGLEVAELFWESIIKKWEKFFLDLKIENLHQAYSFWIPKCNVELSEDCTFELSEKYFSYRREKLKANFVCGIGQI